MKPLAPVIKDVNLEPTSLAGARYRSDFRLLGGIDFDLEILAMRLIGAIIDFNRGHLLLPLKDPCRSEASTLNSSLDDHLVGVETPCFASREDADFGSFIGGVAAFFGGAERDISM